jgi:ATP-dependent helicase/nuclease subunit A
LVAPQATVSLVGDLKQSIYAFRGADVRNFEELIHSIEKRGGQRIELSVSYRTHQQLLDALDGLLRSLLPAHYRTLRAHRAASPPGPHLEVYAVQGRRLHEAQFLAERIAELLECGLEVHTDEGHLRPLRPSDIAILSRTWRTLEIYAQQLQRLGLPAVLTGGGELLKTQAAQDGLALLAFLSRSDDRLALAALLRSPMGLMDDRALFELAQRAGEGPWLPHLDGEPARILSRLLEERHEPPSRILALADQLTGYTAILAHLPDGARRLADWKGFVDLVSQLEGGYEGLEDLVERLRRLAEARLPRPSLAGEGIQLLSIHAAKGLEWPVVWVGGLEWPRRSEEQDVIIDPRQGIALRSEEEVPGFFAYLEQLKAQQEDEERRRLLYVALTRARDYLFLSAARRF